MRFQRWWRTDRVRSRKFDPSQLPEAQPPTADEATEEGILLAEFSARMRLKNRLLMRIIGDGVDFDEELFRSDAREVIAGIRDEMTDAAARMAEEAEVAETRHGRGSDMHDYHRADVANLALRERTYLAVADRLEQWMDDEEQLTELVRSARDDAWYEVSGAIGMRLDTQRIPSAVDADYKRGRAQRIRVLKNVDLARLVIDRIDY